MTSPSSSSPVSSSDAPNKAKAASKTEKAREGDAPGAQTTAASQPRKTEVEEVELRMPGPSTLGTTAMLPLVRRQGRVLLNVCMLGNLWRRMQLRRRRGQGHPTLRISPPPLHLDLPFYLHLPLRLQSVPPLRCYLAFFFGFFGFFFPLCSVRVSVVRSVRHVRLYKMQDQFFILNGSLLRIIPLCSHDASLRS